jgi:phage-related protein
MSLSTFTWIPDLGARKALTVSKNVAKFGDGYEQRSPKGINHVFETWTLTFTANHSAIALIQNFLEGVIEITSFKWRTPEGKDIVAVAENYSVDRSMQGLRRMSVEFRQVFDFDS